ncbi:MAG: hypothetical protein PVI57_17285 [Gemmatimonadota bacterium]|jgi:hypothetical protein
MAAGVHGSSTAARFGIPVCAGAALFAVNNFLLARFLTALPGGTILAPTDLFAVGFVVLRVRRFGALSLVFVTYAALGFLGHVGVDGGAYLRHLPLVLVAALAYDGIVTRGRFRSLAMAVGLLPFAAVVRFEQMVEHPGAWAAGLAIAYLGLASGLLAHRALRPRGSGTGGPEGLGPDADRGRGGPRGRA